MPANPTDAQTLRLLARRVERLAEEYEHNAPALIKTTELRLINEACQSLLDGLEAELDAKQGQEN